MRPHPGREIVAFLSGIYILHPYHEEFAHRWDDAQRWLLPETDGCGAVANNWREFVEPMIPALAVSRLADYIDDNGESNDFLIFACDLVDILGRQWSTLQARRRKLSETKNARIWRSRIEAPPAGHPAFPYYDHTRAMQALRSDAWKPGMETPLSASFGPPRIENRTGAKPA